MVGLCFHSVGDLLTAGEAGASVGLDVGCPGSFGGAFFRHFGLRSAGMAFLGNPDASKVSAS